ncbi:Splicing factor 3B subunit 1 [Plutella xylostella]|uniref:Splicing factor 3B subunit 1 n=2 Tax=Plutella xylostella TaxID=51655 RepID=A0ABQ7QRC9_PLUXY|nr:splicing factor 3B subunit 1 [Plutella xylostella]KAG7307615.1 Splicing factor 3B subunit 1 [Plutella xylostella]
MEKIPRTHEAIEAQIKEIQAKKNELPENGSKKSLEDGYYDSDIYDNSGGQGKSRYEGYVTSIAANDEIEDEDVENVPISRKGSGYTAPASLLNDIAQSDKDYDPFADKRRPTIADREDEYRQKRRRMIISPERMDPFAEGGKTPDVGSRTYTEIMKEQYLRAEETELRKKLIERAREGTLKPVAQSNGEAAKPAQAKRKGRWDQSSEDTPTVKKPTLSISTTPSSQATPSWENERGAWEETPGATRGGETPGATPSARVWDATPGHATPGHATPGRETPAQHASRRNRWDETPKTDRETPGHNSGWAETPRTDRGAGVDTIQETPTPGTKRRSRWDETPGATPAPATPTPAHATPSHATPSHATPSHGTPHTPHTPVFTPGGSTPVGVKAMGLATPTPGHVAAMTPEQLQAYRWEKEIDERNRPFSDDELDAMFPAGYKVLPPPAGYVPIRTPARKLTATPTPLAGTPIGFFMQTEEAGGSAAAAARLLDPQPRGASQLPFMKPEDAQYFDKLLVDVDEDALSPEDLKERKIMKLLLKIKNGTPPMCKAALRQITDKAREFGAGALFNQILPLLMSPTLEDQERHLLVKVIDRILYKLDDLVRPYVHKILVVIEPLLIDEDYYARVEGREIISNLAKAAGLATMISTMRPDIDNIDEYVRNTTARAFAVVASALGIPSLLPFLKAVCRSKKSWQARHTGIKIVQQIAILMGCAILPHLKSLVEIIEHGLVDEQQKVRTITALASAALAEAATPYGIESFDSVLKPLWKGIRTHRGKGLAAFLKAIGYLIPLMDAEYANYYTREVMLILIREFQSPDEEMKKIVLKVVKQCCGTDGVEPQYIMDEILPHFFKHFWNHRMALDRRNYRQLVDTTVEIANKVGASEIINRIVDDLKDDNEQYRKMVMESIEKILANLGAADIDSKLEEALIDGILYAFQEQTTEDVVMLNGFGTIVNQLGKRVKPYLPQICGIILWRMNNKSAKVRQQAADLISRIAVVMKTCQEEKLMGHLGVVLYEYLGEEYPEVLGSILGALKAIVNVIGMTKMTPPIKDLLPRLTPILKNRHEKVQENCIDLVGRIADRGPEFVSAREWMRICFELLELLKAHKKAIRRATVNTFGYIAKAIGPHDVLATLLNNLKVQERQNRVCTTVAIAIVAETCSPFTVLPALMNEYRVPELNVQNGVLKSLSFLFEYIGEMGKDYIYAVCPLLEDALMDRDLVHRQTACAAIKHMALGVYGFGCEDALVHLLNHVWPNIFETSPHLVQAFMDAVEGMRVALGPAKILQYALQGLFHPARKVRDVYWKIYNTLYIGGQDALVAGYPRLQNDPNNHYVRYELDYLL